VATAATATIVHLFAPLKLNGLVGSPSLNLTWNGSAAVPEPAYTVCSPFSQSNVDAGAIGAAAKAFAADAGEDEGEGLDGLGESEASEAGRVSPTSVDGEGEGARLMVGQRASTREWWCTAKSKRRRVQTSTRVERIKFRE